MRINQIDPPGPESLINTRNQLIHYCNTKQPVYIAETVNLRRVMSIRITEVFDDTFKISYTLTRGYDDSLITPRCGSDLECKFHAWGIGDLRNHSGPSVYTFSNFWMAWAYKQRFLKGQAPAA